MKGIDKICTIEATNGESAKAFAEKLHPNYYVFTYKSLSGRKQNLIEKGSITKYKLYMERRKRK